MGRQALGTSGIWTARVNSDGSAIGAYAFTVRACQ
jgi:hypothetical protein